MPEEPNEFVILWGCFEEGYELIGPFDDRDDAMSYVKWHKLDH